MLRLYSIKFEKFIKDNMAKTKFEIIFNDLRNELLNNRQPGDLFYKETELLEKYSASKMTIRKVVAELSYQGYLDTKRGVGTFVSNRYKDDQYFRFANIGLSAQAELFGKKVKSKILIFEQVVDIDIASKMELDPETILWHWKRVRFIDDSPIEIEETYAPLYLFPDLTLKVLQDSFFEHVKTKGMKIGHSSRLFKALIPTPEQTELLQLNENTAIFYSEQLCKLKNDEVFEYSFSWENGDEAVHKFEG